MQESDERRIRYAHWNAAAMVRWRVKIMASVGALDYQGARREKAPPSYESIVTLK